MTVEELGRLFPGRVIRTLPDKVRVTICFTHCNTCADCGADIIYAKCVRYNKLQKFLMWECFTCYLKHDYKEYKIIEENKTAVVIPAVKRIETVAQAMKRLEREANNVKVY